MTFEEFWADYSEKLLEPEACEKIARDAWEAHEIEADVEAVMEGSESMRLTEPMDLEEWRKMIFAESEPHDVEVTVNGQPYLLKNVTIKTEIGDVVQDGADVDVVTVELPEVSLEPVTKVKHRDGFKATWADMPKYEDLDPKPTPGCQVCDEDMACGYCMADRMNDAARAIRSKQSDEIRRHNAVRPLSREKWGRLCREVEKLIWARSNLKIKSTTALAEAVAGLVARTVRGERESEPIEGPVKKTLEERVEEFAEWIVGLDHLENDKAIELLGDAICIHCGCRHPTGGPCRCWDDD